MIEYIFIVLASFIFVKWTQQKPLRSMPAYNGVPILGVLPFLGANPAITFMNWSKKLGPVFRARMGMRNVVVLNDFETIHECLSINWKHSSDRPNLGVIDAARRGHGVICTEFGKSYNTKKKIAKTSLIRFIGNNEYLEEKLHDEMKYVFEAIDSKQGQGVFIKKCFENTLASIICRVAFGKRLGWDNKILKELLRSMYEVMNSQRDNIYIQALSLCDWLRHFPPFSGVYKRYLMNTKTQENIITTFIKEHRETRDKNVIRDTIDLFLNRQEAEPNNPAHKDVELNFILGDLFIAGVDTTTTHLMWIFLYLAANKDVQEKIYNEIREHIGVNEVPRYKNREKMPYTQSFIDEMHRHRTITPLSVWRKLSKSTTVSGINIPGGTTIIPNLWAVHHNSKYFINPNEVIPDRFVDKESKEFVKSPYIIPFGLGMRKCLGYKLAEKEGFLTLCNILQNYKITEDPNSPLPDFNTFSFGFVYSSAPFKVCFHKR